MNLLEDPWLPFRKCSGEIEYLPVSAIVSPEVIDLALPRADFQGAAYQFLIGLLQTAYAPESVDDWIDSFQTPPTELALGSALEGYKPSFNFDGDGPRVMQDMHNLTDGVDWHISKILLDSPSANAIENNKDHFVKDGRVDVLCPDCAAIALITLELTGPSLGSGHRTGVRGGGPLTTLVLCDEVDAPIWKTLWLNIVDCQHLGCSPHDPVDPLLFPWMGETKTSENDSIITPDQVHQLHVYWAMPHRMRLQFSEDPCNCPLCGRVISRSVVGLRTKPHGGNYDGSWLHPLTPYRKNPQKLGEAPYSVKAQPDGIGYRHWEGLFLKDQRDERNLPAESIVDYSRKVDECAAESIQLPRKARAWVFGYDLDKGKTRGWYNTQMPIVALPIDHQARMIDWLTSFVSLATETANALRTGIKNAWFSKPDKAKGDIQFIDVRYWERTEYQFYEILGELADRLIKEQVNRIPLDLSEKWYRHVRLQALEVFDELALSGPAEAMNMKRVTRARNQFLGWFAKNKTPKNFRKKAGLADVPSPDVEMESAITEQSEGIQ